MDKISEPTKKHEIARGLHPVNFLYFLACKGDEQDLWFFHREILARKPDKRQGIKDGVGRYGEAAVLVYKVCQPRFSLLPPFAP